MTNRLLGLPLAVGLIAAAVGVAAQDAQGVYSPGKGITNPIFVKKVDALYTEQSKSHLIRGEVWIDAVVQADGTVTVLGVSKSLDKTYGLDDQAVAAAKQWLFVPGKRAGVAVPVRVKLIVEFRNAELGARSRVIPSAKMARLLMPGSSNRSIRSTVWMTARLRSHGASSFSRAGTTASQPPST